MPRPWSEGCGAGSRTYSPVRCLGFILLILALAFVVFVTSWRSILTAVARFLIVEDRLAKADIIVVLSGGVRDERVRQAADLYHQGYAPQVMLSGGEELQGNAISDLLGRQALTHGIPASALLFETASTSTYEQARNLRTIFEERHLRRAIVVTSSYHTRRTRYLFRKVFKGSPVEILVYPVQQDHFSTVRWWTRAFDTGEVVLEYVKLGQAVLR